MVSEIRRVDWSADLETGIAVVDQQHRQYFVLLNNYLEKASAQPADDSGFFDLLEKFDFLQKYAREHFSTEESLMQEAGFPNLDAHRWEHRYFEHHVGELYERLKDGGFSLQLAHDVNYYINEWFVEHIRLADMAFVGFLHDEAAGGHGFSALLKRLHDALFKKAD